MGSISIMKARKRSMMHDNDHLFFTIFPCKHPTLKSIYSMRITIKTSEPHSYFAVRKFLFKEGITPTSPEHEIHPFARIDGYLAGLTNLSPVDSINFLAKVGR